LANNVVQLLGHRRKVDQITRKNCDESIITCGSVTE